MMSVPCYCDVQQRELWRVFPDLIRYRGLLFDLVSKEFRARYRNAALGIAWAVLQPLLMALVLAFVFTLLFRAGGRNGIGQSALDILCKLVFWQFFSASLLTAAASLVHHRELVKKVCFPRETIPLAAVSSALINLVIGFGTFLVLQGLFGGGIRATTLLVPVILLVQIPFVIGAALLFGAINVHYRDVAYALEVLLALMFYASPILYRVEYVYDAAAGSALLSRNGLAVPLMMLYNANPLVGVLTACQQVCIEGAVPDILALAWPAVSGLAVLALGVLVFRRLAPTFADHL